MADTAFDNARRVLGAGDSIVRREGPGWWWRSRGGERETFDDAVNALVAVLVGWPVLLEFFKIGAAAHGAVEDGTGGSGSWSWIGHGYAVLGRSREGKMSGIILLEADVLSFLPWWGRRDGG